VKDCFGSYGYSSERCLHCPLARPCIDWKYNILNVRRNWWALLIAVAGLAIGSWDIIKGILEAELLSKAVLWMAGIFCLTINIAVLLLNWKDRARTKLVMKSFE
jgi:hypothetical protein